MDEFKLIDQFFKKQKFKRQDVLLGIGDDAALLIPPKNQVLVSSMDTLIEGVHFLSNEDPYAIGYKSLAVNFSDLAAMGAQPAWMMLAITMPSANLKWLKQFSQGLLDLAQQFNVQLIGGDTTSGPLSITIQVNGFVPRNQALRRDGAKNGDSIYVSGTLGDAALALQILSGKKISLTSDDQLSVIQRLIQPTPQIELGIALRNLASSAIDISDGLMADLSHILTSSRVGATINAADISLSTALQKLNYNTALKLALTGGDDYELCFTVPPKNEKKLIAKLNKIQISYQKIGEIKKSSGLHLLGFKQRLTKKGFRHF